MNCPVCNTTELSEDTTSCPQCHSDLEIFGLIVEASDQRQKHKKIISALSVFAAVTAIGWASVGMFSGKTTETAPVELSPAITIENDVNAPPKEAEVIAVLTKENEALKSEIALLSEKINSVKSTPTPPKVAKEKPAVKEKPVAKTTVAAEPASEEKGTITHTVRNGDTFWIISRKYFGSGTKYKQIAKDNGLSVKAKLHKGQKLKIVRG